MARGRHVEPCDAVIDLQPQPPCARPDKLGKAIRAINHIRQGAAGDDAVAEHVHPRLGQRLASFLTGCLCIERPGAMGIEAGEIILRKPALRGGSADRRPYEVGQARLP